LISLILLALSTFPVNGTITINDDCASQPNVAQWIDDALWLAFRAQQVLNEAITRAGNNLNNMPGSVLDILEVFLGEYSTLDDYDNVLRK
jgi:hypothetical protein